MQELEPSEEQYGSPPKDQQDTPHAVLVNRYCPLCEVPNCQHFELLQKLKNLPASNVANCELKNHNKELKLFCKVCIKPICEECNNAEHKLHEAQELYKVQRDLKKNLMLQMLNQKCINSEANENSLKVSILSQIKNIETEMDVCCQNLHNEIDKAFQTAKGNVENLSKELRTEYEQTWQKYTNCQSFLSEFVDALEVSEDNYSHIIQVLNLRQEVLDLFDRLKERIQQLPKTAEKCITLAYQPVTPVVEVQVESKMLKPVIVNRLADKHFSGMDIKSLIVLSSDECLISCKARESNDHPIYYCRTSESQLTLTVIPHFTRTNDFSEWCILAQLKSKEIVALCTDITKRSSIKYLDDNNWTRRSTEIMFDIIKQFDFVATSIAVTNDNNILVCVSFGGDCKKSKGNGYLMLLSLRGKVIKDTVEDFGNEMICPEYVAVSESGEICASNTSGNSIIILNKDLEVVKSIKLQLPTSFIFADDINRFPFSPCGLCYDYLNRIVITDQHNCSVLRLSVDPRTKEYKLQPLIAKGIGKNMDWFQYPEFTAVGPDLRLWVACKDSLFVFEYVM